VINTTNISSLYNYTFGFILTERYKGYDFFIKFIKLIRAEINTKYSKVVIIDFKKVIKSVIITT
ncbi:uncharacterized protein BDZ83DRAFT_593414, partial [Colletotrichum acutatum]